ncbi:MAG: hypothetical protein Q4F25_06830 [Eubacteriales bacterium]|nr:hypothetical protein [Eubacteriales bacterium]
MKKFDKNIDDRKVLVARLSELTGLSAHYTRIPRCAYEIGAFTVEKDGCLTVEEGADESILQTLISENLIGECIEAIQPVSAVAADMPAQIIQPNLGTEDWGEDDWEGSETTEETHEEQAVWQPETDIFAEMAAQREPGTDTVDTDTTNADAVPDAQYEQEAEEESAASLGIRDAEETEAFPLDAKISFPIARHTVASLTNLICMIHTRGSLISKATGGTFRADKDMVDDILDRHAFSRPEELVSFVQEWNGSGDGLVGISFDEEKVTFDGFTGVRDQDHLQTFMKLAAAMNKMAQTQKRVQAKETDDTNEKYSLRVWLVRLGLNGPEYKAERKILMENLSGHPAFRTPADEEKWKTRQNTRKLALKAAKEAEAETAETE